MRSLLLLLLILLPFVGCSQTISTGKICFTPTQAAQIADSLQQLPLVRGEAAQWHKAAASFERQGSGYAAALADEKQLYAGKEAEASEWKKKARRRGLVGWLERAAVVGGIVLLIAL